MGGIIISNHYNNLMNNETKKVENDDETRSFILSQIKKQESEYKLKYDENVLVVDEPYFIHSDIIFDIYIKSIQKRINNCKLSNKHMYYIEKDFLYIGKESFNDYYFSYLNQTEEFNLYSLNKSEFLYCQKIIYNEITSTDLINKFELYIVHFINKIIYFIFLTKSNQTTCYYKIYEFQLDTQNLESIRKEIIIMYEKYYIYYSIKPLPLIEIQCEYYLKSIKEDIDFQFTVIDLIDIKGFYMITRNDSDSDCDNIDLLNINNPLLKNPLMTFHFKIEKLIKKLKKLK